MKLHNKKTGEIWDMPQVKEITIDKDNKHYSYISLAELNENWEDYEPKEHLIKDEKIRKAVRAWAEANNIGVVRKKDDYCFIDTESAANIRFFDKIGVFLKGSYTISELCGEEE